MDQRQVRSLQFLRMAQISFDPARKLNLYFRVARDGSKTFSFVDTNGADYDISGHSFEIQIKYKSTFSDNVISLANGDLTRPNNYSFTVPMTVLKSTVAATEYYWQLNVTLPDTSARTWLTGSAIFHNGEFDGVTETTSFTIDESGAAVTITINEAGGDMLLGTVQTVTAKKTFETGTIGFRNPANTFSYNLLGSAIIADRTITLPLLTSNDVIVTAAFAQTLTNKTLTSPILNTPRLGTSSTIGYVWTATDAIGNGTWAAPAAGGGGALSALTAATGTNTINNVGYAQEWQWNSLAGAVGLKLSSTSTAAASNAQALLEVNLSGANATSTQTTYSGRFVNTHTGTASTNVAGYFSASGGTNNYAGIFASGKVGIGLIAPTAKLQVKGDGTTTGSLFLLEDSGGTDRVSILDNGSAEFVTNYNTNAPLYYLYNTPGSYNAVATNGAFMRLNYDQRASAGSGNNNGVIDAQVFYYNGGAAASSNNYVYRASGNLSTMLGSVQIFSSTVTRSSTSGSGGHIGLSLQDTYNFTGTYVGNVYGIYYNPTLTSMTGVTHYAAAFASGNVVIGASTGNANAILDVQSTTKAFMPPRMTTTQRDAIPSPTAGMVIYNTTTNKLNVYTTAWEAVTSS